MNQQKNKSKNRNKTKQKPTQTSGHSHSAALSTCSRVDFLTHTETLDNGIQVLAVPRHANGLVYLGLLVRNGLVDEDKSTLGFTHAFEHLMARMTSKKHADADAIRQKMGQLGIIANAFTTRYTTGYWMMFQRTHWLFVLSLLANAYFEFRRSKKWAVHKNIVLEELRKRRSANPWAELEEEIAQAVYPPNHRFAARHRDEVHAVSQATQDAVIQFNQKKWTPDKTVLMVEGDIALHDAMQSIRHYFQRSGDGPLELTPAPTSSSPEKLPTLSSRSSRSSPRSSRTSSYRQSQKKNVRLRTSTPASVTVPVANVSVACVRFVFLLPFVSCFQRQARAVLTMLQNIFCSGYYARLNTRLREQHGLTYSIKCETDFSPDPAQVPSVFQIDVQTRPEHVQRAIALVNEEIDALIDNGLDRGEMQRLKNETIMTCALRGQQTQVGTFAMQYGQWLVWHKPIETNADWFDQLLRVKAKNIVGMAKRVFRDSRQWVFIGEPQRKKADVV